MRATFGMQVLRSIPLFTGLNESECRQVAEVIQLHSFAAGEPVIRQGESSRNLWVLLEGNCHVCKHLLPDDPDSESVLLATIGPYQHFGEMSFFHPAPHSADVRAMMLTTTCGPPPRKAKKVAVPIAQTDTYPMKRRSENSSRLSPRMKRRPPPVM